VNCHCSQCRKQHGAPFRSRVGVQFEDFRWLQGEHLIKYYESVGGYLRGFCRECGSPIINRAGPNWKRAAQFLGDYEAAIEWASRSVALNPTLFRPTGCWSRGRSRRSQMVVDRLASLLG
jgi:hypothetical protein